METRWIPFTDGDLSSPLHLFLQRNEDVCVTLFAHDTVSFEKKRKLEIVVVAIPAEETLANSTSNDARRDDYGDHVGLSYH